MSGKKDKLLITGGLGNLGSWLTTHFSTNYEVYVTSRSKEIELDCEYKLIDVDITDYDNLKTKLNLDFDYCIHTASYNEFFYDGYAKNALMINSLGTRNLIEVLKDKNIKKFIYLSTFHVYGTSHGEVKEETILDPKNDYATTHLFAEYYLKQFYNTHSFPYLTFRLTNSYGSPLYQNSTKWYLVLNDLVKSAFENKKIVLKSNGKALRDFIWMGDVCNILEKSLFVENTNDVFNLSSSKTYTILELANKVKHVYENRYAKLIDIEINESDTSESKPLVVDNSKLKKIIDFQINDKFDYEINNIFDLLEKKSD